MTREEAIKILQNICFEAPEVKEALQIAIDALSRLSLPSNLDEAAFSYENNLWESGFKECGYSPQEVSDSFKAGAEWMAGQGASYNTEVGWIDGPTVLDWPDNILDGFKK